MTRASGLGLVLDLSHAGFAAVLDAEGDTVRAYGARAAGSRHDDVAGWIESLLQTAEGSFSDLSWICVGVGPGSFTGIRIAMAFAQGLALPQRTPLHGFTSFEALRLSFPGTFEQPVRSSIAVIPANAGRFYLQRGETDPGALLKAPAFAALSDSTVTILAPARTDALEAVAEGFASIWTPSPTSPSAGNWNAPAIAQQARRSGRGAERPEYLQLSAAEEKFGPA